MIPGYRIIDLTHSLSSTNPTWSGAADFHHPMVKDHDQHVEFKFRKFEINAASGCGTHMDAPIHCAPGGKAVHELALNNLCAPCIVIDISDKIHAEYIVSAQDISDFEQKHGSIKPGTFVIIRTGWERFWDDPARYRNNLIFPSIGIDAAQVLLDRDVAGLGVDTLSPDLGTGFPVHNALLQAGKYMVENVANSESLPATGGFTMALPIKIENGAEAPVRLIALIPE